MHTWCGVNIYVSCKLNEELHVRRRVKSGGDAEFRAEDPAIVCFSIGHEVKEVIKCLQIRANVNLWLDERWCQLVVQWK